MRVQTTARLCGATLLLSCMGQADDGIGGSSYMLSEITWTGASGNVSAAGNDITRTSGTGWNAGASSAESISGDGSVEFTTGESNTNKMLALSNGDSNFGYTELDFAIYLRANKTILVYENGTNRGSFGSYNAGDTFRIEVEGSTVTYAKNGSVFYTSTEAPTFPLNVDTSLHTNGGTLQDVVLGSFWQNTSGVSVSDHDVTKTGSNGWNAGASTGDSLSDNGGVEFSTAESNLNKMAGLSNGDSSFTYTDIDFAFYLRANGQLDIYESGSSLGNYGSYSASDTLRISYNGGQVKYYRNDTLLYTSLASPTLPLLFDTSLYSTGATITDVTFVNDDFWQNTVGASTSSSDIIKTSGSGWNAGASTTDALAADGQVEFTTEEETTFKMAGLSNGDSSTNYDDIDFAFYMRNGGRLRIYEGGADRGSVGTYTAGDVLKLVVASGVVTYYKNDVLLYTSEATPTAPLLFDTSLFSNGATISDVTFTQ